MSLRKKFQVLFNNRTINQDRIDLSVKLAEEFAIEFHNWCDGIIKRVGVVEYKKHYMNKTTKELMDWFSAEQEINKINTQFLESKVSRVVRFDKRYHGKTPQQMLDDLIKRYNDLEGSPITNILRLEAVDIKRQIERLKSDCPEVQQKTPLNVYNF